MQNDQKNDPTWIVVGQFAGAHGVQGLCKIRSYTEYPADVAAYGVLHTDDGRTLTPKLMRESKPGLFVAKTVEIKTREECDAFKAALLYVQRTELPAASEDEFYYSDLVGLQAVTVEGAPAGEVKAVVNYGAGDIIELGNVPNRNGLVLIPFDKIHVPHVRIADKQLVVVIPVIENETSS